MRDALMANTKKARALSHWGWGYAERFGDQETRKGLGQMAGAMLGLAPSACRDPVAFDDIELAPSAVKIPDALSRLVHAEKRARVENALGRALPDIHRGFMGDFSGAPDAVAFPENAEDVVRILDFAEQAGAAVIPRGGGTSVVGGVNAHEAGGDEKRPVLVLNLRRMKRVLEVIPESLVARIEAGATGPELEEGLSAHGMTLRHFPQSFEFSTLGGWIATRAGGHFATLYTHIDDLTASTRMVSPSGTLETRRLPGSGAGPAPDRMVLGSEGALGVITDAWMRIRPRPIWRAKANVLFDDYGAAVAATRAVAQSGLFPSNCRLLDKREALLNQVPAEGKHILLLGFESADHPVEQGARRALAMALEEGGICPDGVQLSEKRPDDDDSRRGADAVWKQAFFDGPYLQTNLLSVGLLADTFETACPWDRFKELHGQVIVRMRGRMKEICGGGFISCRFTHVYPDGPAPYFTWIAPFPKQVGGEMEAWRILKKEAMDAVVELGGTITHHHAVGRLHVPGYQRQVPALFREALSAVKGHLDPARILNPGVLGL
jgi:alkyldihydroxyacetonephosphate synthase